MTPHRFEVKHMDKLVDEVRQRIQPAEDILHRANPSRNETCADIGCGVGYMTLPLSVSVRFVVALDSQREMLMELISRASGEQRRKILPLVSELPNLPLRNGVLDRVLIVNVLHEIEDKKALVSESIRALRSGGRITLVDFQKTSTSFGPPVQERIDESRVPAIFDGMHVVSHWSYPEFYQYEFERH